MILGSFTRRPALWAVGCGAAAVLVTTIYFRAQLAAIANIGRPIRVLVAAQPLAAQTLLHPAELATAEIPRQFVPPGALTDPREAVGRVVQAPLVPGEVVTRQRIAPAGDGSGFAAAIPARLRALALPVDAVSGVAGLIEPGNFVDLLATFDFGAAESAQSFTMTVLERVPVLAVDQRVVLLDPTHEEGVGQKLDTTAKTSRVEQTVTVALIPEQVQRAIFAQENGRIRLALRPQQEVEGAMLAPREPATAASVTGMTNLIRRREYRGR